ncbi:peptide ABC transporter substrate-binding protein [Chloroflexi bacterium TSY]|nr:peptide ABC transporter substrate-binding protein [Chloroflexi bacterium TSY]
MSSALSDPSSSTPSFGKHLRWQFALTLVGILLLLTMLGYSSYTVATVVVPDRGGVFREGVAGNPRYLSPLRCQGDNEVDQDLCSLLFRGLTRIDKHGRVVPDLAESWTVTDNVIYTFHLKPDLFWHDGQPITIDDVIFTISVLQDPDVYSLPSLASLWRAIGVEKIDDLRVRFTLSEPFTPFLDYTAIGLLPRHVWGNTPAAELANGSLDAIPVSNGPLRVAKLAADHIRLEPNPFYAQNTPFISALELHFYPDHPSLFAAYVAGEIDGLSTILPSDLPAAKARNDLQLFSTVVPEYTHIIFNLQNPNLPFFQDVKVRQALYYGIDRERLIAEVVGGQGIIAHSLIRPENWAYNSSILEYPYDPGKAWQLLDEAGWIDTDGDGIRDKNGRALEFQLVTNDNITWQVLVERIALEWEALGVRAVPTQATMQGLVSDLLTPRRYDAALISWEAPGDPDPYPLWHSTQAEGGGQNYSGWSNEEADQVMQEARAIADPAERMKFYWRFQEIFAEQAPAILLYHPVYTYGVSDRIQNVQIGSLNQSFERFTNFVDWYIITKRVPANQVPEQIPPTPPG